MYYQMLLLGEAQASHQALATGMITLGLSAHPAAHCCEGYDRPGLGDPSKALLILLMPRITVRWYFDAGVYIT